MTTRYRPPRLLGPDDLLDRFEGRSNEQAEWLRRHASQSHAGGTSRVLVVTPPKSDEVVAYYSWCMAAITSESARVRLRKGAGRYPQQVALRALTDR